MSDHKKVPEIDLTGRKQFLRNFTVSGAASVLGLVVGFIVPRQISDNLGIESLGIWDVGWSLVRYLQVSSLGMAASLNRYTALYHAEQNLLKMSRALTSVVIWQIVMAVVVTAVVLAVSLMVGSWMNVTSPDQISDAGVVLLFLGLSVTVKILGAPAGGLLTGYHRTDLQHSMNVAQDIILAILMVGLLIFGFGLQSLAIMVFCLSVAGEVIRWVVASRVCPDAKFNISNWDYAMSTKMLQFGVKSVVINLQRVSIFQTLGFILAATSGPIAIAIFNRSVALNRYFESMVGKVSLLLTPMTSGLIGTGNEAEARSLILKSLGYTSAVTVPVALVLIFFGDLAVLVWMGEAYANQKLMIILTIGAMFSISQTGSIEVVKGFNAHGRFAIYSLLITLLALAVATVIGFRVGWDVVVAAYVCSFAQIIGRGIVFPVFLKLRFDISLFRYHWFSILKPLLCNLHLILILFLAREMVLEGSYWEALAMIFGAGLISLLVYWRFVLSESDRLHLQESLAG